MSTDTIIDFIRKIMKKRKRYKQKQKSRKQRDAYVITKPTWLLQSPFKRKKQKVIIDDQRRWKPHTAAQPLRIDGRRVSYTLTDKQGSPPGTSQTLAKVSFADARKVMVCRRRKERRETLFKRKKIGKGKRVTKRRRRTRDSDVKC